MTDIIQYNLQHIQDKLLHYTITLDENIESIFSQLDNLIVVQDEGLQQVPLKRSDRSFDRNNRNKHKRNKGMTRGSSLNDMNIDDWEAIRNFKPTEKQERVGIDKYINDIRALLNKISKTNYNQQKGVIIEKIDEIFKEENQDHQKQIGDVIFSICTSNKFLSEVYADLYVEFVGFHDLFGDMLDNYIHQFRGSLHKIQYVDPNENYDEFCEFNKTNEIRKSNATFLMNLVIRDMITKQSVLDLILDMQSTSFAYIDEENKEHEVEELTENLFIMITMGKTFLHNSEQWTEIQSNIDRFTKLKAKEHKSLSSRSIFKYMDM
tara:strand:- start:2282 stop:3244 length:963 start_codon:yes stop_codon:yes gene_type:complete